jgi:uncharacterized repeat protein (TIGR03803 family)
VGVLAGTINDLTHEHDRFEALSESPIVLRSPICYVSPTHSQTQRMCGHLAIFALKETSVMQIPGKHRSWISSVTLAAAAIAMAIVIALTMLGARTAQSQTFTVLHTFTGGTDGELPEAGLTLDAAGNLYGTASAGGSSGSGTVYKLTHRGTGWTFSLLYSFAGGNDGATPIARVIFGPNGTLYGTTEYGGNCASTCGTVFNLVPPSTVCKAVLCPWDEKVIYRFQGGVGDGSRPGYGDLVFDRAGSLYGTTILSGANSSGIVYELTPSSGSWTENILYNMTSDSGVYPYSGVIFDHAGNLYGTAFEGGPDSIYGTVYELTPSGSGWTENTLYNFQEVTDGSSPYGGVIFDSSGNLYGTTSNRGPDGAGTVFKLTPSNGTYTFTVLHSFAGNDGPYGGLTMDAAGNLYGTTYGDGVHDYGNVFELSPSNGGWSYTDLYDFTGGNDGGYPFGSVAIDADGNLYGTTAYFGTHGYGVVWEITP